MSNFPITVAQLAGNFCETLTYGIYLATCIPLTQALFLIGAEERWRRSHEIRWFMLSVGASLFCISTFDVAIGLYHNIFAFVTYHGDGGAPEVMSDISSWVNISRTVTQVTQAAIGDFVLIYRCWVVYARRWKYIILSSILYLAGIAVSIKLVESEISVHHKTAFMSSSEIKPWSTSFFGLTMGQTTLTTGLLIWRIWRVEHEKAKLCMTIQPSWSNSHSQTTLRRALRIIAESGAIYTSLTFATFVAGLYGSNALYPLANMALQATGICFNIIIVQSTARRDQRFTAYDQAHGPGRDGLSMSYFGSQSLQDRFGPHTPSPDNEQRHETQATQV